MQTWLNLWQHLLAADRMPTLVALGAIAAFTLIETLVPAERGQGLRSRVRNLVYMFFYKALGLCAIAAWFAFGPNLQSMRSEPRGGMIVVFVFASLFVTDFLYYWYHRAQHRFAWLWAIHELHHSDSELNVTTSFRTYWLEAPVQSILIATPTVMLLGGRGITVAIAAAAIGQFFLIFSHWNVRLSLGPMTPVLCGPQLHRIHHSRLPAHRDKNFAQIFPVIDQIFGTYHAPTRDEYPPTGAEGLASDASIARAFAQPFLIWGNALGINRAERSPRSKQGRQGS